MKYLKLLPALVANTVVWIGLSYICEFVCLFVHALKGKLRELSTPKSVEI